MKAVNALVLIAVLSLAGSAALADYSVTGTTVDVDVLRNYNMAGTLTTTIGGALVGEATELSGGPSDTLDGGEWGFRYFTPDPTAGATVDLSLKQAYAINKLQIFTDDNHGPVTVNVYSSTTGLGALGATPIATAALSGGVNTITLPSSVNAQYLEYQFSGGSTGGGGFADIEELTAYADVSSLNPATANGYDLLRLPGVTVTDASTGTAGWQGEPLKNLVNGLFTSGDRVQANGGDGDARLVFNLGTAYALNDISLGFTQDQQWTDGFQVEISTDGIHWVPVGGSPTPTGGNIGQDPNISFASQMAQYIRVTDYGASSGPNGLIEVEAFGNTPEPASLSLLGVGTVVLLKRRRRR